MIITLLTDFGLCDNFAGVIKGVILGINAKADIVDISHSVKPGDIFQGAFLLESSYKYFPAGTIHLVIVDPGVGSKRHAIIAKTGRYYFVGPDNGVLSLALKAEGKAADIVSITNQEFFLKPVSSTFHGRDIFAPAAAYLSRGISITEFGTLQKSYKSLKFNRPRIISLPAGKGKKILQGRIVYIDRFGNLITDIREELFRKFVGKGKFRIYFKNKVIDRVSKSYADAKKDKPLAIFGSFANLEISVSRGSARDYFRAKEGLGVRVAAE
ncbi:MAG: SAM-dependent chlorinase/fluorinase [Candidatus Omnitrophota bacterium]